MQTEKKTTGATSGSSPDMSRADTSSAHASDRPSLADSARHAARREMDDARRRLHGAADRARGEARQAGSSVSRLVMDELDKRKGEFCEGIHGLAESMRKAADEAEGRDDTPAPPRLIHQAVNTLDDMADRLRHRSAQDLAGAVSRFGRENPALFVAGAVFAGLALGRFAVSSASDNRRRRSDDDEDAFASRPHGARDDEADWASMPTGAADKAPGQPFSPGGEPRTSPAFSETGSGTEAEARDLRYGQGGVPLPAGGSQTGGASTMGGTGTAGLASTSPGEARPDQTARTGATGQTEGKDGNA